MTQGIPLRDLGRSGLKISAIGLGCWQFSRGRGLAGRYWPNLDQTIVNEIVKLSLGAGLNWFDTAEGYGHGESERALAQALHDCGAKPGEVVIATKWTPFLRRAASIRKTIGVRRRNLGNFPIDLYQVHNPYSFSHVETEMEAMADLVRDRMIGQVGVSNFSAAQMRRAATALEKRGLSLASNQVRYSLLDRRIEADGTLEAAREMGVTIIAYSPLAQGILSGKFHDDPGVIRARPGYRKYLPAFKARNLAKGLPVVQALREIAVRHGARPAQVALSWVIHNQGTFVVAIPGATTPEQARDNGAALRLQLTPQETAHLSDVSAAFRA